MDEEHGEEKDVAKRVQMAEKRGTAPTKGWELKEQFDSLSVCLSVITLCFTNSLTHTQTHS